MTNSLSIALGQCRRGLLAVGAFSLIINLLMLTVSIYMLQIYDRVLSSQSSETLVYLTVIALGALAILALFDIIRSRILVRIGTWLDRVLSAAAFRRGIENAVRGNAYTGQAVRDVATFRNFIGGAGIMALFDSPWVPVYIGFIYLLHPILGHVSLAGAVGLFALALITNLATHRPLVQANVAASSGFRAADSAFRNAEVIDGMGMADALAARWERNNLVVLTLQAVASDRAAIISSISKFLRLTLQVMILGVGAWLVIKNQLTAGGMVAASIVMSRALAPVEQAIGAWRQMESARGAWKRLSELFTAPPLHPQSMALPQPRGHLTVENVTFTPPGADRPVLKDVSLEARPGEAIAVIGPSAAGKSTLARLIVGIARPEAGSVRLDGAEVHAWNRNGFGYHVGYLPQDVELFPGTIRDNIARMRDDSAPEDVIVAAKLAGLHDIILRLPNGYETEIGERGAVLSGGQRQRIGLARALFGRPALVVLDEPNASLDASGEDALNIAIRSAKQLGMTLVIIAHRPSLMAHVDRIVVLNEGNVQMYGERNVVLAQLSQPGSASATDGRVRAIAT